MKRANYLLQIALLGAATLAGAGQAAAATAPPANLNVSMTISASCVVTTTALTFPVSTLLNTAVSGSGNVNVQCTNSTGYDVALGVGAGSGATVTSRKMTLASGTATIGYGLYRDAGLTQNWGNTTGQTVTGNGTGAVVAIPVYGSVPAQTTPQPGTYNDTVAVVVTY